MRHAIELDPIQLNPERPGQPRGIGILEALLDAAQEVLEDLGAHSDGPCAALGRVRGTGRGVSFSRLVAQLEADHPIELRFPFEGSDHVGGAVWRGNELVHPDRRDALAKLHWKANARDLPMHAHEHSDRFIIVLEGRGYFHVTDEPLHAFTGNHVRTIPARERDVFAFTRSVVHTFSTADHGMTLLSCQLPFLPFDDPGQYTLPEVRWTAAKYTTDADARVAFDPNWRLLC
ncbi:MAG: cupin domain-containing protein [Phycisphaera sp.]|nr:MAG: cupin domain-containing protein [Phycisphaera sp.]